MAVGVAVAVGVWVGVGGAVGVEVAVGVGVRVGVCVTVGVGVLVNVPVAVAVGVDVGVAVWVAVGVRVAVFTRGLGKKLFKRKWGQTEYALSAVPLGGYVKMAGGDEGEEATGAPDEFVSKKPWQRALVLAAGPVFSVLFGIPLAVAMFLIGREVPQAKVSHVSVGSAAWHAGVKVGDEIKGLDGREVETMDDLIQAVIGSPAEEELSLVVERGGERVELAATREKREMLGVGCQFVVPTIKEVVPDSPADEAGLEAGDVILSVEGKPIRTWQDFRRIIHAHCDLPVRIEIERDGVRQTIEAVPEGKEVADPGFTIRLPAEIGEVRKSSPADGKLKVGDRIVAVNGRKLDAQAGWGEIEQLAADADKLVLTVERGNGPIGITEFPARLAASVAGELSGDRKAKPFAVELAKESGIGLADSVGIVPRAAYIVTTIEDSDLAPGLQAGDEIVKAKGERVAEIVRLGLLYLPSEDVLSRLAKAGTLEVWRPSEGQLVEITLEPGTRELGQLGVWPTPATVFRQESLGGSFGPAVRETAKAGMLVFTVIRKLVGADVKGSSIAGPVGIFHLILIKAREGWAQLFWLVHLLTVNIGLLNLLPIPPLDGGRLVMVGYEKVRGKRMGRKAQDFLILAGIALLLLIFVYATFNDLRRLIGF